MSVAGKLDLSKGEVKHIFTDEVINNEQVFSLMI